MVLRSRDRCHPTMPASERYCPQKVAAIFGRPISEPEQSLFLHKYLRTRPGLACSMLILLWVKDELTWDRIHSNIDQLYRVPFGGIFAGIYGLQKPRDGKVRIVLDTKNAPGPYAEKSPFSNHGSPDQA